MELVNTRSEKLKLNKLYKNVSECNKVFVNGLYRDAVKLLDRMKQCEKYLQNTDKINLMDKDTRFSRNIYEVEDYIQMQTLYNTIVRHISEFAEDTRSSGRNEFAYGFGNNGIIEIR